MVEGNQVPGGDEIGTRGEVVAENNPTTDALQEDYRRTVGFQPQDVSDQRAMVPQGYDRNLGYDRIAVGNTALGQRIDNITNLLAMGERSAGNLQDVNRYYGRAQKEADDLFTVAAQNVMKGREDYRAILAAKNPQEVFQGVNASIQKQEQALQLQLQQEQDPARQRRLGQLLAMEQERRQTLERMQNTNNPQELNRLLMYDAFSAQRIDLSHKMLNERDPNQVRLMAEAEQNLHTVQRAPGFTRANYGMLLMRLGQYDPNRPDNAALRALQDAASVDPEMVPNPNHPDPARRMGDPNFMRVASDITRMRPDDPQFAQVMAPVFNRDINRSPAPLMAPGDQNYNPNARYSQVQEQPFNPATDGTGQRDRAQVTDQQGPTPLVRGKTPFQRVQELAPIVQQQGLTSDVRQAYASCIQDSDKGTSPRVAELQAQLAQLEQKQQQIAQQVDQIQKSPEIQALVTKGMEKLKALKPEDQQQLKTLTEALQKTQDKQERERLLGEIGKVCPEFVQVTRLLEEKLKPFTDEINKIQQQGAALSGELIGEMNQSSATRMEYAEKLMASGKPEDKQLAKQLLIESVAKARPEQQKAFADAAMKLGLTQQELQQGLAQLPADRTNQEPAGDQTGGQTVTPTGERTGAGKLIDDNKKAFDAAQDKKAKLEEMRGSFQKAITDADKEFTDAEAKYTQLNEAHTKAANEMPAEDKAKFQKMGAEGTPEAEKQALQQELMAKYANIVQLETQMQAIKDGALDLALNKFEARYEYARAANLGGDDKTSKEMMEAGIKTLTKDVGPELTAKVLEDPGVAELVGKHKLDANALMQAAAAEVATQTPTGDPTAAGGDLQGTLRVANARMQKGDIAGAKQAYEQAIKMVDASFNPEENNKKIKEAQDLLESGNLTIEQRLQKQQEIAGYFNQAYQAFDIRSGYARVLAHPTYNQNAAAEQAFKDAITAADRVPVQAMKRQLGILANDIGTFQTAFEQATGPKKQQIEQAQAFLTEFSNTLNGQSTGGGPAADKAWMNTQINARKDLASFYVRLVSESDEKGQPILKPDGTPRYRPDASKVFKPEEGMKAIDDAKVKHKELYGTDLDADPAKDPTLAILAKGIYDNSPAELQKKYQNVSRYWDDAKASLPTIIAGTATALLMAKWKPLGGLIKAEGALATWAPAMIAGTGVATVTRHTMMTNVLGRTDETWGRSLAYGFGGTVGGVALMQAPKLFSRGVTNSRISAAYANAESGTLAMKSNMGEILKAANMGDDGVRTMLNLKQGTALTEQTGFGLNHLKQVEAALAKNPLGLADDVLATQQANLAKMIENSSMRTKIFNIGRKVPVDDFDAAMAAASPSGKQALLQQFLKNKEGQKAALDMVANTEKYATAFEANGLRINNVEGLAQKLTDAHIPFTQVAGTAGKEALQINIRTVGELKDVLPKLAEINPRLFGAGSAKAAGKSVEQMLSKYKMLDEGAALKDVWASAARGTAEDWKMLDVLKQFTPEAQAAARSRFGNAVAAWREEKTLANMYGITKEGLRSTGSTLASPVTGTFRTFGKIETQTASQIGRNRFLAGSVGGAGFYAGTSYPVAWNHMYGEGNIDPKTGKPYEFSFSNAIVAPAWKNEMDNIFVSSFLLGGMAAKPGQALLAQAPWANARVWWKPFSATGHVFTGSTWNYLGSRAAAAPIVGDIMPAITTNIAMGQFDLLNNLSNRDAGRVYTDAINKTNDPIVDDQYVPKEVPQQQQPPAPVKKPNEGGDAGVTQPRKENTDLTGGAPQ